MFDNTIQGSLLIVKRKWKIPLFGCFDYKSPDTKEPMWCPYFCPMSTVGTCCIIGRNSTLIEKEQPIALGLGPQGFLCCLFTDFACGPVGFCICTRIMRTRVIEQFNVDTSDEDILLSTLCYPCSQFQMYVSMLEWEAEDKKPADGEVANPVLK